MDKSRAPPVPQIEHSDDTSESLVDVDSIHVSTVSSDFGEQSVQTHTQADRLEREAEAEERELEAEYDELKREVDAKANEVKAQVREKKAEAEAKAEAKAHEVKAQAHETKAEAEAKAKKAAARVSKEARAAGDDLRRNSDNPVVIGNVVVVAAISAALGFGAYRKYTAGQLTWKVVGAWAGVIGLFAAGDFYFSQYVFPPPFSPLFFYVWLLRTRKPGGSRLTLPHYRYLFKNRYPRK